VRLMESNENLYSECFLVCERLQLTGFFFLDILSPAFTNFYVIAKSMQIGGFFL
jgi:hypothetical protein